MVFVLLKYQLKHQLVQTQLKMLRRQMLIFCYILFKSMSFDNYFKQIRVSSVKESQCLRNVEKNNFNSSIIDEINLLQNENEGNSGAVKIQSFIYAQEGERERVRQNNINSYFCDEFGQIIPPIETPAMRGKAKSSKQQFDYNNRFSKQIAEEQRQFKPTYYKKSIKEELEEQNKLLQKRLKANHYHKLNNLPQRSKNDKLKPRTDIPKANDHQSNAANAAISGNQKELQFITKLEEQYGNSTTIKLYNFIMKVFPICQICKSVRDHITNDQKQVLVVCKKCFSLVSKNHLHPLIGVICDLQNKRRFEEETTIFESIIDEITIQIQKLQAQVNKLDSIKQRVSSLRNINRKKYKQINNSKFYIRKSLDDFDEEHVAQLQKIIPKQFVDQMQGWRQIDNLYQQKWKSIFQQIYKLMPLYLHQYKQSKLLSGLHKILNYEKDQGFRLSVSEHIKFPIKKIDSVVFMVDGAYNLPVFDNVKHLTMQFHHKKTQRELSMLFTNFPRQIYSLNFQFNHKLHSHISAQCFPFLEFMAPIDSIKKISIKIQNLKEFKDLLALPEIMTQKIQFKLILTKHLFSRQQLILPEKFYMQLIEKLGPNLVRFQVELPESVKSVAFINYEVLIQKHKLCFFQLKRGQKDEEDQQRNKILQDSSQDIMKHQKRKQLIFKRLICGRLNLLKQIKSIGKERITVNSIIFSLLEGGVDNT